MSIMPIVKPIFIVAVLGVNCLNLINAAEQQPLAWSNDIMPGMSEAELIEKLDNLGIQFAEREGGLTYSSMITTSERDYLFCQDRLYVMIEGVFATGREFNTWFQTFLASHRRYGEPKNYKAQEDIGRFVAEWDIGENSTLHFQLQSDLEDRQGWSRQLYAKDIGAPCM